MAVRPITGFGGGPVLNYTGDKPVAMESPCPYSQWDVVDVIESGVTLTHGAGWARATVGTGFVGGTATFSFMGIAHAQGGKIGLALAKAGTGTEHAGSARSKVGGFDGDYLRLSTVGGGPLSGEINVQYYRYRLNVVLSMQGNDHSPGDWVQVDFTLT